jgi:hypothetical protein
MLASTVPRSAVIPYLARVIDVHGAVGGRRDPKQARPMPPRKAPPLPGPVVWVHPLQPYPHMYNNVINSLKVS